MSLIKPISFIGPGQCPFCGTSLVVVENEQNVTFLNKDGTPRETINTKFSITGECINCKEQIPLDRKGMHYVPKSRANNAIDEMKRHYEENYNPFMSQQEQV